MAYSGITTGAASCQCAGVLLWISHLEWLPKMLQKPQVTNLKQTYEMAKVISPWLIVLRLFLNVCNKPPKV